jgi:hypothetical protein
MARKRARAICHPLPRIHAPAALSIFAYNLLAVGSYSQKVPHHAAGSRSLRGTLALPRCWTNLRTISKVSESPDSNPLESCRGLFSGRTSEFVLCRACPGLQPQLKRSLGQRLTQLHASLTMTSPWPHTAFFARNTRLINDVFLTPACERTSTWINC